MLCQVGQNIFAACAHILCVYVLSITCRTHSVEKIMCIVAKIDYAKSAGKHYGRVCKHCPFIADVAPRKTNSTPCAPLATLRLSGAASKNFITLLLLLNGKTSLLGYDNKDNNGITERSKFK